MYFTFFSNEGMNVHVYVEDRELDCEVDELTNILHFGKYKVRYKNKD